MTRPDGYVTLLSPQSTHFLYFLSIVDDHCGTASELTVTSTLCQSHPVVMPVFTAALKPGNFERAFSTFPSPPLLSLLLSLAVSMLHLH